MVHMNALVKQGTHVSVRSWLIPPCGHDEVRVRVRLAGICRTDIQVARGEHSCADPLVLGHECAGVVDAVGAKVTGLEIGTPVAVQPILGCQNCLLCRQGNEINCPSRRMLGLDRNGAFAGFVTVPARCIFPLPVGIGWREAAYAEPIAAALAVLDAGLPAREPGLVLGHNRFARLVGRLLEAHGYSNLTFSGLTSAEPGIPADSFAFVVETALGPNTLEQMIRAVRVGGTLILKSRRTGTVPFPVLDALLKQVTLRAVNYGAFRRAIGLLLEGRVPLDGLLGRVYPLEEYAAAFAADSAQESVKLFLDPWSTDVWDRR